MHRRFRSLGWLAAAVLMLASPRAARAHDIYLAVDNHTDYAWNATAAQYDASMLSELDYYLGRIAATAGNPPEAQQRFAADCWLYLYLYEKNRTPAQFQNLLSRMQSGHITVPLNPLVTLYGALPTEAAIRAGYYPGRIERQWGVSFTLAQDMENATSPWGLASLWAGSLAKYTWKGICACVTGAPYQDRTHEVFRWRGPDDRELLMKWYQISGQDSQSWGGYAEARNHMTVAGIQAAIDRFSARPPYLDFTGLFGVGWDDVNYQSDSAPNHVQTWNDAHPGGDTAHVSNIVDYFERLEGESANLPIERGGWGNDWDLWPVALAERTAATRRAVEHLHAAEAMAAIVSWGNTGFFTPHQAAIEAATVDYHKYFDHVWGEAGPGMATFLANKKAWAAHYVTAVDAATTAAATALASFFATPDEDRFVVLNPLAFARTDVADLPVAGSGPWIVTDVATAAEVPSQVVTIGGATFLRILATDVPSLGWRTYRYAPGTPASVPLAATVTGNRIEDARYRIDLGARGELTSVFDKAAAREIAGALGLNDFGGGTSAGLVAENLGPVSVTLRRDVAGAPARRVRVTLVRDVDRIDVADEILANETADQTYGFDVNLAAPQIRFEEVGAIARPGLAAQGGDFLAGTRADYMTLNHFVDFAGAGYHVTLSNWDATFMRVGQSSITAFDLPTSRVRVVATGNPAGAQVNDQGGDAYFLNRFALRGAAGAFSGPDAMRTSLAHQNPLVVLPLARNQTGSLAAPTASLLAVSAPNVVVTAFKPVEEPARGLLVRAWEMGGADTAFTIDASAFGPTAAWETSLVETDVAPVPVANGLVAATIGAHELRAWRFVPSPLEEVPGDNCPATPNPGQDDADGDGIGDACDVCPAVADAGQEDADGDGIGNACDLCVTTVPGQTAWQKGRLAVTKVGDGVAGNDGLKLAGRFTLATGAFTVDPLADGLRLEIRNAVGTPRIAVTLPPGPYTPPNPGWTRNRSGTSYTFRTKDPAASGGIAKVVLRDKRDGNVQLLVMGAKGTFPLVTTERPLAATVVLGGAASGAAGECGELAFPAPSCRANSRATTIDCK